MSSAQLSYPAASMKTKLHIFQGDKRTYNYAVGISSKQEPDSVSDWQDLLYYAKIIPRICTSVNRVCYVHGGLVKGQISDITPTYLTRLVMSTIRQADSIVTQVISYRECIKKNSILLAELIENIFCCYSLFRL